MSEFDETPNVWIGDEPFLFVPAERNTLRADLYNPGHFSMFDVLVHLRDEDRVELEYHYDVSMNTYVVDSLNHEPNWWYVAYYHEGSPEQNAHRMDHYVWREGSTLRLFKVDPSFLSKMSFLCKKEVTRREKNKGKLVLPKVIIRGSTFTREFEDVEIVPSNMRKDVFREGTTTVLDVLKTLENLGLIECKITWFKKYGSAQVEDYWIISIDGDRTASRSGWAYEVGHFRDDHRGLYRPHIPIGLRVLNSPDFVEFFWHV